MTTSGSVNYSVTRNDIINEAAELLGIKDFEEDLTANEISSMARSLELMIKYWHSKDIYLWKTETVYLFFAHEDYEYDLGPTGDHATLTKVKTEISTAAASGASSIVVDSITGISNGDAIGIELDDGTLQWTTVNGAPSGSTITLTASLTDTAAIDNNVYAYTSIIGRPLTVDTARLYRDASASYSPVQVISRQRYRNITLPTTTGKVNQVFYDPKTTNGKLKVWPAPDDVKDYLELVCKMTIEDFDSSTNNPDFPQEWFLPMAWNLACYTAPKFGVTLTGDFQFRAEAMLQDVMYFDTDGGSVYFEAK